MAIPTSRTTFKDYLLRQLGEPVIQVNVDPAQIEDAIDNALLLYEQYHFDGTERVFYKHTATSNDITNQYLTLDPSIIGVTSIFDIGMNMNINSLFNLRYQLRMNDLFDFSSKSYVPYIMAMRHIETLQEQFIGKKPIRWNRHTHILHIDFDWTEDVRPGDFIIIDCYMVVDPNVYTGIWSDTWLRKYATALLKVQWGTNMKKFKGMTLLGGQTMDGQTIYDEGIETKDALEKELLSSWSLPTFDMIGGYLLCLLPFISSVT